MDDMAQAEVAITGPPLNLKENPFWTTLKKTPGGSRWAPTVSRNLRYPDSYRRWQRDALAIARPLLASKKFDAIYSSSPPVSTHLVGMRLKHEFGVPWIADFRDPWTGNELDYKQRWKIRRFLDFRLERRVLESADAIVANTRMNRDDLILRFRVSPDKVVTIPNGYDEGDFLHAKSQEEPDFFRVTYSGSAYGDYTPAIFERVLRRLLANDKSMKIRWTIAGKACVWAAKHIKDEQVRRRLDLVGYLPHDDIPGLLLASHCLLHVYPATLNYSVPGKLYEYLRVGTPILAICTRPSEVERILSETGCGRAFRHDELEESIDWLRQLYSSWESGTLGGNRAPNVHVMQYERKRASEKLGKLLDHLVEQAV